METSAQKVITALLTFLVTKVSAVHMCMKRCPVLQMGRSSRQHQYLFNPTEHMSKNSPWRCKRHRSAEFPSYEWHQYGWALFA